MTLQQGANRMPSPIIVTDSTCDLPRAIFDQYDIHLVPLRVLFGDESYRSGVDMHLAEFAERLAQGDVHPTTSQPTVHDFKEIYQALGPAPVLSIHVSHGLSGTYNTAYQAAQALPDQSITVWDSGTISAALGLQVLTAARAAQAGYPVEQILPLLEQTHAAADFLFVMDDLSYLVRGGRLGTVQYHVAQALHIKPVITVSKAGDTAGIYVPTGRVRSLEKAVDFFYKHILKTVGEGGTLRALSFYGTDPTPDLVARLNAKLEQHFNCVYLASGPSTPVLGVHVGPKAMDIGFVAGDWPM
jgi:DegV family protein with EDD domain